MDPADLMFDKSEYWFLIPFVIFVLILICIWVFT